MKTFFLVLLIVKTSTSYEYVKIPITTPITEDGFYCDLAFEKTAKWIDNPNYESGNGQVWGYYIYQGQAIGGHYCIDEHGKYIL